MENYATTKCIVHIDMDCFYAQVEAVRLGLNCREVPFILSQWGNLIAVNYPARAKGIARFNTVKEARELCPGVLVGIVPTYRVGESVYAYHTHAQKDTHKVALEPYREASRHIFSILHDFPRIKVEKASVDEAFVDVTEAARAELAALREVVGPTATLDPLQDVLETNTKLVADKQEEIEAYLQGHGSSYEKVYAKPMRELKRHGGGGGGSCAYHIPEGCTEAETREYEGNCLLLCAATRVVQQIRAQICDVLHYDCSAGIAHNRLLAKSISATHKPNQQTLLLPDRAASALYNTKVEKLRGFGGKFGHAVARVTGGAELCQEAWLVPLPCYYPLDGLDRGEEEGEEEEAEGRKRGRAAEAADSTSRYAYYRVRGYGDDGISERVLVKSLMASKHFGPATTEVEGIGKWLVVLCNELASRYEELTRTTDMRGRNVNVKLGSGGLYNIGGAGNRTAALPDPATATSLYATALHEVQATLRSYTDRGAPVPRINAVTVTIGALRRTGPQPGQRTLTDLFSRSTAPTATAVKRERAQDAIIISDLSSSEEGESSIHRGSDDTGGVEEDLRTPLPPGEKDHPIATQPHQPITILERLLAAAKHEEEEKGGQHQQQHGERERGRATAQTADMVNLVVSSSDDLVPQRAAQEVVVIDDDGEDEG